MSGCLLLIIAVVYFTAFYFIYGKFISRVLGVDPSRPTPAHTRNDGVDYTPARPAVLFGHHFASIAGSGPILGPIFASELGWGPAILWILLGSVFFGGLHDFAALFLSVRHEGKSISSVIEELIGYAGRMLFSIFCWTTLVLVVAMFALMTAEIFIATPSAATASLIFILLAPVYGFFVNKGILSVLTASLIFVPLTFLTVYVGMLLPCDLTAIGSYFGLELSHGACSIIWLAVLGVYVFIASVTPVQWLLQPRDFLNSFLLYAMLVIGFFGIVLYNPHIAQDAFHGLVVHLPSGADKSVFPTLFIVIACGACSGFHSLVASGTTSKQVSSEKDIQLVGYGGMLLEGVLGVISLISVIYLSGSDFTAAVAKPQLAFASGIATFSSALGFSAEVAGPFISLVLAAFMMTSLDTATRLGRFIWQEILLGRSDRRQSGPQTLPAARRFLSNSYVASVIIVLVAVLLCVSGKAGAIWPVFGASNQLLAALTLLGISLFLLKYRSRSYIAFIPMIFMTVMSCWGLGMMMTSSSTALMLVVICAVLLLLTALLMTLAVKSVLKIRKARRISGLKPSEQ
ncbi:MAG: carbon starvation protein A [Succinivibrionaceae bacterium]|nr:carbon starvation protein A [Succinivibrionaceae bacterium]